MGWSQALHEAFFSGAGVLSIWSFLGALERDEGLQACQKGLRFTCARANEEPNCIGVFMRMRQQRVMLECRLKHLCRFGHHDDSSAWRILKKLSTRTNSQQSAPVFVPHADRSSPPQDYPTHMLRSFLWRLLIRLQYQPGYANGGMPASAASPRPKINPEQVRASCVVSYSSVCCRGI